MASRISFVFLFAMVVGALAMKLEGKCKPDDYHCGDGRCIPSSFVCDKIFDCGDGNDEKNCKADETVVEPVLFSASFDAPMAHMSMNAPMARMPMNAPMARMPMDAPMAHMPMDDASPFGDEGEAPVFPLEFGR